MTDFTLDQLLAGVQAQTTVVASLQTYVADLQAKINAVSGLTAAQQTEIDGIFTAVQSNTDAISAAMVANTPSAP